MRQRQRPTRRASALGSGLAASLVLHGAAGAVVAVALAWRTLPSPPGAEAALEMVWLPATDAPADVAPPEAPGQSAAVATLAPLAAEGTEPEDALATQLLGALQQAAPAPPAEPPLPPLSFPAMEAAEPPPDPATLFAPEPTAAAEAAPPQPPVQLAALPEPMPPPEEPPAATPPDPPMQVAALPVPLRPAPEPAAVEQAVLPLPPPLPPPAPRRAATAPPAAAPHAATPPTAAPQPAAMPVPAPAAPEPAAIPVLSGQPRFRRPPAPPTYPDRAREAGIEGTALLRLRVGADGTTLEIRLLRSAGNRWLDEAAQAAARRWEIAPALQNGRAIEAWVEVPVRFRLDE